MFRNSNRRMVNLISRVPPRQRPTGIRRRSSGLLLEVLEDRLAPATHVWTGAMNNLWSNSANWVGGAPSPNEANVILQFNTGSNPDTFNNISGLSVHEIDLSGKNTLNGFAITLPGNTNVTQFSSGNGNTIHLELDLTGTALAHNHVFTVVGVANFMIVSSFITSSGPNNLDKEGAGALFLSNGGNSYGGSTLINQGTLLLQANNAVPKTSAVTVNAGATFDLNTFNDAIGSLAGAGNVVPGGVNFPELFTGGDNTSTTFSGVISGNTALIKDGTGTLTLAGHNTLSTFIVIDSGTLRLGVDNAIPATCHVDLEFPGAKFDLNNFTDSIGELNGVANTSVTLGNRGSLAIAGVNLTSFFAGTISGGALSGIPVALESGTLTLAGPNTYGQQGFTNFTLIGGGATLKVGNNNALPSSSSVLLGGTLDCNNFNPTIGSLEGTIGTVNTRLGSLTTGANNRSTEFGGTFSGSGPLFKVGSGTLTLTGFSTESFIINIDGGTVLNNGFHPNLGFNVGSSGTLAGFDTIGSADVGNSPAGGTLSPGSSIGPGRLSTSGLVFFNLPSTFRVRLNGTTPGSGYDQLSAGGPVNLANQPTLDVALGFPAQINDSFTIISAAKGVTGHFKGLTDGTPFIVGGAQFQIHYTSTSVVLTRVPGPATQYLVSATSSSQAGTPFDVTVTALDPANNIVNTYNGTVHFTTSDPSGGTLPADYTFTPADNGVHTFAAGATLFTAGSQTITATDASTGFNGSATVTVTPAPAVAFAIAAPASASSGSPFDITVTAQDPFGNTDTNYQGTITFTSSDTDPGVVLPADYTFQPSDAGSVTFSGGVTLVTLGDQTVTATDTTSGINGTATVTVITGPLAPRGNPGPSPIENVGASLPVTEKTVTVPLAAGAVDALFAATHQDAQSLAGLRSHHHALAGADDGFWDWVSNDNLLVV